MSVYWGNAAWKPGLITLAKRPESVTSLVPTMVTCEAESRVGDRGRDHQHEGGDEAEDWEGQQPAEAGAGRKIGGKRAPTRNGMGHEASISGPLMHCLGSRADTLSSV